MSGGKIAAVIFFILFLVWLLLLTLGNLGIMGRFDTKIRQGFVNGDKMKGNAYKTL